MIAPSPIDMERKRAADLNPVQVVVVPRKPRLFDRLFPKNGHDKTVEPYEPRSTKSHNHFFAAAHEAWKNLPEQQTPSTCASGR